MVHQTGMIQTWTKIIYGSRRRIVVEPFIDVGIEIRTILGGKTYLMAKPIPAACRNQMRGGDRSLEAIVHGFVVGFHVGAIEPPDKGIQPESAEFPRAPGRKFLGVIVNAPHILHEIKVLLNGMAEVTLEECGPLSPADDTHVNGPIGSRDETSFRQFIQSLYQSTPQ